MKRSTKKNWTTIGILFVVLLALGGLATWDEWKTKQEQEAEKNKNRLTAISPDEVVEVTFYNGGREQTSDAQDNPSAASNAEPFTVTLVKAKDDGTWRLKQPIEASADSGMVAEFVKSIVEYSYSKVVGDSKTSWQEYGLVEPARSVSLKTGGDRSQSYTVHIGDKSPVGFNVYIRTDADDKVYMGSQHLLTATAKTLFDFRHKSFVSISANNLKKLTYAAKDQPEIVMERQDSAAWTIREPIQAQAAVDEVRDFISELSAIKAASFEDAPAPELAAAIANPLYKISWTTDKDESGTARFVRHAGKFYGAIEGVGAPVGPTKIFGMPDDLEEKVKRTLLSFRNRRVLQTDVLDVAEVSIDGEAYKNVNGMWYKAADASKFNDKGEFTGDPKDKPAEAAHIRALVVDLEFARTDEFIPLSDAKAKQLPEAPSHRIQLAFKDTAKAPVLIELFPVPDTADKYLVRKSGGEHLYRMTKATFNSMKPGSEVEGANPLEGDASDLDEGEPEGLNLELDDEGASEDPLSEESPTG